MSLQVWLPLGTSLGILNDYDTTIYKESDGSLWLRIFHHNNPTNNGLFASTDDFTNPIYKNANKWSNLQLLNQTNSWELMVKQKATSSSSEMKYRWIQLVNPYTATYDDVTSNSVIKITVPSDATSAIGGMYHIGASTYFCITNGANGNWFGAIGAWSTYNNGIPGYPNTSVTTGYLDLYMRIDEKCLRNLGTSGILFNATNDAKYNLGKVTNNSLENTSNTVGGYISNAQINLGYHQSMFCWVYFNSFYASASLTGILGQHRYASNQGMGLTAKYVSSTSGYLSINTGNGSDRTFNTYCGNTLLTSGKWYHVGYTYDGTTVTLYVNGNVDGTFTITDMKIVSDYIVLFAWSLDGTSGATIWGDYKLNGRLNDVRLYNHCLSLKEVKNLAKGLMLHYKLSKSGANLLKNTATEKSWTYSGTSYSDSDYSQETITPASDSYYTMSFDAKSNRNSTSNFITYLYNNNSGRQCDSVKGYIDGQLVYTGSASDGTCPMPTYTYYRHYVIVRHFNSDATALTKQNVFRIYNAGSSGLTMYVKNAKIEIGNHATPWIPNSTDTLYTQMGFDTNIENDISGYGNNGTRINITTWNTDTARYLSSMVFNGDNGVVKLPFDPSSFWVDFTISVWIYKTSIGTKNYQTIFGGPSGFELEARNNAETNPVVVLWNWGKGSGAYEFNKWNHVVMTRTSSETKLYINGTQVATGTAGTIPSGDYFIGAWNTYNAQNFEGRMSDFRIYSTALSSEDVLELYRTSASIDKNDNIHCYELTEN